MTMSKLAFFQAQLAKPCSGDLREVFRFASSRYRCRMEGSLSERWEISSHFSFLFLNLMQNTEQTSIDLEFTECLNTSFAKSSMGEKMKGGGASAQQHQKTESGNLSCNHSKSQEKKTEEDANNNNEENLRRWKTKLDAACHGERLSPGSGESLDGCQFRWTDEWMEESVLVFSSGVSC